LHAHPRAEFFSSNGPPGTYGTPNPQGLPAQGLRSCRLFKVPKTLSSGRSRPSSQAPGSPPFVVPHLAAPIFPTTNGFLPCAVGALEAPGAPNLPGLANNVCPPNPYSPTAPKPPKIFPANGPLPSARLTRHVPPETTYLRFDDRACRPPLAVLFFKAEGPKPSGRVVPRRRKAPVIRNPSRCRPGTSPPPLSHRGRNEKGCGALVDRTDNRTQLGTQPPRGFCHQNNRPFRGNPRGAPSRQSANTTCPKAAGPLCPAGPPNARHHVFGPNHPSPRPNAPQPCVAAIAEDPEYGPFARGPLAPDRRCGVFCSRFPSHCAMAPAVLPGSPRQATQAIVPLG